MILFFGRGDDPPLAQAVSEAAARGAPHLVLDQRSFSTDPIVLRDGHHRLAGDGEAHATVVELDAVSAVYARPLMTDGDPAALPDEVTSALTEWLDYAPCLVVNRPRTMRSNGSKPFQLQLIAASGFTVPETLVTNEPDEVHGFLERHGRVVYKSISGIRSIVRELDADAATRMDRIRHLPTQFQEYVPGVDVRVHVVGSALFATEIVGDVIDYRYAHLDGREVVLRPTDLPDEVAERCLGTAADLDLPLCGIDLRRRPDGGYVCLEVNPMPAYSYFEANTGQAIAAALVQVLAQEGG